MKDLIQLGDISIHVTRKEIKNVHLSVHPPDGRVSMSAPVHTRLEVARAYAISKMPWIRRQQEKMANQQRETPRKFVKRESHYLWGRRYLLNVVVNEDKPAHVSIDHKRLALNVKKGSSREKRAEVLYEWQKTLLHEFIREVITKWEMVLEVRVNAYFIQRMKTKWGSCNHKSGNIRLNTELVKKPKDLAEYVIVHEMMHLIVPTHNEDFVTLMNRHYPNWREARQELNELPLGAVEWGEVRGLGRYD